NILFVFMLVAQSMLTSLGFGSVASAEGADKNIATNISYIDENNQKVDPKNFEGDIFVQVDWSMQNDGIEAGEKEIIELSVPEQILLNAGQSGVLEVAGIKLASYEANPNGNVAVTFTEEISTVDAKVLEGTFALAGVIEAK